MATLTWTRLLSKSPRAHSAGRDIRVSILGLGGWHLGVPETDEAAVRLVHAAIDAGVTFLDNAWDYNDGLSEDAHGQGDRRPSRPGLPDDEGLHARPRRQGRDAPARESLRRLQTDYLDLWQIHEVVFDDEPARTSRAAVWSRPSTGACSRARCATSGSPATRTRVPPRDAGARLRVGRVPAAAQLLRRARSAASRQQVLPELNRRGIAPIGMKSLGGDARAVKAKVASPEEALAYALSLPIATVVSGMGSVRVLKQNVAVARGFKPMTTRGRQALSRRVAPNAVDGRFELYKIAAAFEGEETRRVHGLPKQSELPT